MDDDWGYPHFRKSPFSLGSTPSFSLIFRVCSPRRRTPWRIHRDQKFEDLDPVHGFKRKNIKVVEVPGENMVTWNHWYVYHMDKSIWCFFCLWIVGDVQSWRYNRFLNSEMGRQAGSKKYEALLMLKPHRHWYVYETYCIAIYRSTCVYIYIITDTYNHIWRFPKMAVSLIDPFLGAEVHDKPSSY